MLANKKVRLNTTLFVLFVLCSVKTFSQFNTWTGATDTDWHKSCNWSLNTIPTCSHDVIIPNVANQPTITDTAHSRTVEIQSSTGALVDLLSSTGAMLYISSTNSGSCVGTPTDNGGCGLAPTCFTIGGANGEFMFEVKQTSDGGFIMGGSTDTYGAGNVDGYVVKLNAAGTIDWTRTIGGGVTDVVTSIDQTSDGGYILGGYTDSYGAGLFDWWIIKLNSAGVLSWSRTLGGATSESANSILQTSDGGYIMSGTVSSFGAGGFDLYVVKFDATGVVTWTRTVGNTGSESSWSVIQTSDGGYAVSGWTNSYGAGSFDAYVIKLTAAGAVSWTRVLGGTGFDQALSLIQTSDGGYAFTGRTSSFGAGSNDVYVVKLTSAGVVSWTQTIGGAGNDWGESIIQTTDGGYAVGGYTNSFGAGGDDLYVIKLDATGLVTWTRTVGDVDDEKAYSILQTSDGGYVAVGSTRSYGAGNLDVFFVKLDAAGNSCCSSGTGGTNNATGGISASGGVNGTGGASVGTVGLSGSGGAIIVECN